ncbi:putative Tat pathway signal sequence [Seiridium unicorne]|uniref:Tat pathway signal sequence n=1 Tax=Seiridium unicorne TaxID=138068 RepID=A0ABR2UWD4_9PEZI
MGYVVLAQEQDDSGDMGLLKGEALPVSPQLSVWKSFRRTLPMMAFLCVTNFVTLLLARNYFHIDNTHCIEWQGALLDRLSLTHYQTQRDDILLPDPSIPRHIYRSPPSPEVDAAWKRIGQNGVIAVSEEEVRRAGKDPEMVLKVPEDFGYGTNSYIAILDGVHQVHCLDVLRKNLITNYEYYYGSRFNFTPPLFQMAHVNHCLDSLLQDLMCYANPEITFFNWVEGQEAPQPDFAVNRVCRDYDAMIDWYEGNLIRNWEDLPKKLHWQPAQKRRPRFVGWKEYANSKLAGYRDGEPLGTLDSLPPSCTAA